MRNNFKLSIMFLCGLYIGYMAVNILALALAAIPCTFLIPLAIDLIFMYYDKE